MPRTSGRPAFAYLRLSKWDDGSMSPKVQRPAITRFAREHGLRIVDTFDDTDGRSAWNGKTRPGLDAMLSRLDEVRGGAIIVLRIDRLARSQQEFLKIVTTLDAAGVTLSATDMAIEAGPSGAFVRDIIARVAQLESDNISVRTRGALALKREQGEHAGRAPYGWKLVDKHLVPDPAQQRLLQRAARRFVAGETWTAIAPDLGMKGGPVARIMGSPRVMEAFPDDLAGALAVAMRDRASQRTPTAKQSLLGAIARCGICGGSMRGYWTRGGRYGAYRCPTPGHTGVARAWLESHVVDVVLRAADTGGLVQMIREQGKLGDVRRVSEVEARLEVLDDQFDDGTVSKERYQVRRARLLEQLAEAHTNERRADVGIAEDLARHLRARWPNLPVEVQRRAIRAVVERVEVMPANNSRGPVDPSRVRIIPRARG